MSLVAWYAGVEMHLPPRYVANFMDLVDILGDPGRDLYVVRGALGALSVADPRVRVLAIPHLVALLRRGSDDDVCRTAAEIVVAEAGNIVSSPNLARLATMPAQDLARVLENADPPRPHRVLSEFLDLSETAPHLVALSLLRELARAAILDASVPGDGEPDDADGEGVQAVADTLTRLIAPGEQPRWLSDALRGRYGRVPQGLAAECLLIAGESPAELAKLLGLQRPGAWLGQPDRVRLRLELTLAEQGLLDPSAQADWLLQEAETLVHFGRWANPMLHGDLDWLRASEAEEQAMRLVLWQAMAWESAAALDAARTVKSLANVWSVPGWLKDGVRVFVNGTSATYEQPVRALTGARGGHRLLLEFRDVKGRTPRNSRATLSFLFCPWINRNDATYHANAHRVHPSLAHNAPALRMAANSRTLVHLIEGTLRSGAAVPDYLWDLWLNQRTVFGDIALRKDLQSLQRSNNPARTLGAISSPVVTLLAAAEEATKRLGGGRLHPEVPAQLVAHLQAVNDAAAQTQGPRQRSFLHAQASYMAVAQLVFDELSARSSALDESPWFQGGESSPAADLSRIILSPVLWDRVATLVPRPQGHGDRGADPVDPSQSIQTPALLVKEAFPRLFKASKRSWSWVEAYRESTERIGRQLVLLSEPLSFAEWQSLGDLKWARIKLEGTPLVLMTDRLAALLAEDNPPEDHPWFNEWRSAMEEINHPWFLSRSSRFRLISLLRGAPRSQMEAETQRIALRAILEFGDEALWYQEQARDALERVATGADVVGRSTLNLLAEWLHSMSRPAKVFRTGAPGPWTMVDEQRTAEGRLAMVNAFLMRIMRDRPSLAPALAGVLQSIDDAALTPELSVDESERPAQETLLHWSAQRSVRTVAPVRVPHGAGVVAGRDGGQVLINVGKADPERVSGPEEWGLGYRLTLKGGVPRSVEALPGLPGEVVRATVTWSGGVLRVEPANRRRWSPTDGPAGEAALTEWLPDIMAAQKGDLTTELLARCTAELTWLPARRSLPRLLLEEMAGESPVVTVAVVGALEDGRGWTVSAGFGRLYDLPADRLSQRLVDALDDAQQARGLHPGRSVQGLLLKLRLDLAGHQPLLDLAEDPTRAVDDRNLRWRDRLLEGRLWPARRVGEDWIVEPEAGMAVTLAFGMGALPQEDAPLIRIAAGGWNALAQRTARVEATYEAFERLRNPGADALAWLRHALLVQEDDVLTLDRLTGPMRDGAFVARTQDHLPVEVAADSLSFFPGVPAPGLVKKREVVVHRLRRLQRPDLARPTTALRYPELERSSSDVAGLLVGCSPDKSTAEVWLDRGADVCILRVDAGVFATSIGEVGDRVQAHRGAEGWVFRSSVCRPQARATWQISDEPDPLAVPLAVTQVGNRGQFLVLESPTRPVLYLAPADTAPTGLACGVPQQGVGRVSVLDRGHFMADGMRLDTVGLPNQAGVMVGYSAENDFRTPGSWLAARLILTQEFDQGRGSWWDARREFIPGKAVARPRRSVPRTTDPGPTPDPAAAPEWRVAYDLWRESGDQHALGELPRDMPGFVRLLDLKLPGETEDGPGIDLLPLEGGPRSLLRRAYDRSRVRVRVERGPWGWIASLHRVRPFSLAEFADRLGWGRARDSQLRIWYSGRTPEGRHVFEWGYGWRIELQRSQLRLQRLPFFGDSLSDLYVQRERRTDGSERLSLSGRLRWEVEARLVEDAGQGMLHLVEVTLRPRQGGEPWVDVVKVHTMVRSVTTEGGPEAHRPTFKEHIAHAVLDREGQRYVREAANRAGLGMGETLQVLTRYHDLTVEADGRRRLELTVLTPDDPKARADRLPQAGECLVLTAGRIEALNNDYAMPFRLQAGGEGSGLRAVVLRRQFSLREGALREAFRRDPREYEGVSMLVRLSEQSKDGSWRGSIRDAPVRPARRFLEWARDDPDHAYVVVGRCDDAEKHLLVEAQPGVLGRLEVQDQPAQGSLCRLHVNVDGDGDLTPALTVVVPGDHQYISRLGRPVHLLLKDGALKKASDASRLGFTIADLPGVQLTDPRAALAAREQQPPRLGFVRRGSRGLLLDPSKEVRAGALAGTRDPVRRIAGPEPTGPIDWPQLSFQDAEAKVVADQAAKGCWYYHDRRTGVLVDGVLTTLNLPDPARSKDGPLFFDNEWRLRYAAREIESYGFGVGGILERGLPRGTGWYPVAASAREGGLWIEASPGRIYQIRSSLLHSPAQENSALDGLDWDLFAPGDEVHIARRRDLDRAHASIVLDDWRPGPRGWFGRSRALLPSRSVDGVPHLGAGTAELTWSGTTSSLPDVLWLSPENDVTAYARDIRPGDAVLVAVHEDGEWGVVGDSERRARFAPDKGELPWLVELLRAAGPRRDRLIEALGGVVVTLVEDVAADGSLVVAAAARPAHGEIVGVRLLGLLDDATAVARSGVALLQLPLVDLMPGVPAPVRTECARELVGSGMLLWLRASASGWQASSSSTDSRSSAVEARPLFGAEGGLLALNQRNLSLLWLPLDQLGWGADVAADAVAEVVGKKPLPVQPDGTGRGSLLKTFEGRRIARSVESGETLLALPQHELPRPTSSTWAYLGTLFPTRATIVVESEVELRIGEVISIEPRQGYATQRAVPTGQGRMPLVLSPWLVRGLREHRKRVLALEHVTEDGTTMIGADAALVAAAGAVRRGEHASPGDLAALADWLSGAGRTLIAGGVPTEERPPDEAWSLTAALAGVILLADRGRVTGCPVSAALAVHAAHALGLRAAGSIHEEMLLRFWLTARPISMRNEWARLQRLDLGGRTIPPHPLGLPSQKDQYVEEGSHAAPEHDGALSQAQVAYLRSACYAVLNHWDEPEGGLVATARALLFAIGDCPDPDALWAVGERTVLGRLGAFGRSLTPGPDVMCAQSHLRDGQLDYIAQLVTDAIGGRLPISLIPTQGTPVRPDVADWADRQINHVLRGLTADDTTDGSREDG